MNIKGAIVYKKLLALVKWELLHNTQIERLNFSMITKNIHENDITRAERIKPAIYFYGCHTASNEDFLKNFANKQGVDVYGQVNSSRFSYSKTIYSRITDFNRLRKSPASKAGVLT